MSFTASLTDYTVAGNEARKNNLPEAEQFVPLRCRRIENYPD
jgi:hypothetical protein